MASRPTAAELSDAAAETTVADFDVDRAAVGAIVASQRAQAGRTETIALLVADLAGIGELFAREGDAAGRARIRAFHDAALPIVARFNGRIVRSRADALLAAFATAPFAIEAGVEIARAGKALSPRIGVELRATQ